MNRHLSPPLEDTQPLPTPRGIVGLLLNRMQEAAKWTGDMDYAFELLRPSGIIWPDHVSQTRSWVRRRRGLPE